LKILIADDDRISLRQLEACLRGWGHEVVAAEDGEQAWQLLRRERIGLVISDWMMPKLDGPALCRRIRTWGVPWYVYVVLLTANTARDALVEGLDAGADDFILKPFNRAELRVRLRAGERILELERNLEERNRCLAETYEAAERDLKAAAAMQASLLPGALQGVAWVRSAYRFFPTGYVAGDILNWFVLDDHRVGFYVLDVAGHGAASAMLSFSVSKMLTPGAGNELLGEPALVASELNRRFEDPADAMKYFTMIYGVVDGAAGTLRLVQAGHPPPILDTAGRIWLAEDSGYPVGMLADVEFEEQSIPFGPKDRLFLYSDGVTECRNLAGEQFGPGRLLEHAHATRGVDLEEGLDRLAGSVAGWAGDRGFEDDVTLLAIERA
jgi:sigma-B regulation protein RsbU (phosphoserine phosphatase)